MHCPTCNEEVVQRYPRRLSKFCSMKCYRSRPQTLYECTCGYCKKNFVRKEIRKGNAKDFCSRDCFYKGADYANLRNTDITKHPRWKGGRYTSPEGYVYITVPAGYAGSTKHGKSNYILEHRKVMQEVLGRVLLKSDTVHHKNGIRDDNVPANLELRSGNHGIGSTSYTEDVNHLIVELSKAKNLVKTELEYLPNAFDC